ncbi:MAG: cation-translocating P-type ATPase [Propionicimonas sp.]|nr:cation-translocating P-type ATPase [Propionicimonas sp.]MEA5118791.1 cation-translocating P-type ATPase [Propionicimonas sp.]
MTTDVEAGVTTDHQPETLASLWTRIDRSDLLRVALVAGLAALAGVASWLAAPWWVTAALAAIGLVVGCWPILVEAWQDLRSRRMSMELSMLIAILAAALVGEWVTALVITAFVLAAEILEDLSLGRGRDALTDLMGFLPIRVRVREGDRTREVELDQVQVGDLAVVTPGDRVPVDGVVVEGRSSLDQSRITGESLPVDVGAGDVVFAGSVNSTGALVVRAERVGEASSYGQIVAAVKAAQESEAPVQRLADRVAGWLVYAALAGALVTYLVTRDLTATISVVIVAGACGVAAGTPLAVLAAIARVARRGAFVKDGTHLEELSAVDTVVFDKTGTLTHGEPAVTAVRPAKGVDETGLLAAVAAAESLSEHPIGRAIVRHAAERGVPLEHPDDFDYRPGLGVTARVAGRRVIAGNAILVRDADWTPAVGSAVHVAIDDAYAGTIVLTDTVRDTAQRAVARLQRLGLRIVMMSGDNAATALAVAGQLGIAEIHSDLLPADKVRLVGELRSDGAKLAMVGDGVNDAPALAGADVGIAMGTGTHIARETADVVLISSRLTDLADTIETARRARRIVFTNFAGTIAIDLVGMALAAAGILGPLLAAVVHVGSESAFILNSARLIPRRDHSRELHA